MIRLLDHGYVMLVESWGSDERIVEAARMSTAKGFNGWGSPERPGDEKLLAYLYNNAHMTPFEMAGMTIEVKAPLFVFREWHRHRTQGYNEQSARYEPLPDENYIPLPEDIVARSLAAATSKNRQAGSTGVAISHDGAGYWLDMVKQAYEIAEWAYRRGLEMGVPKELARITCPVARYSRMRATANLRNWLAFLKLRLAPNAQKEIRLYAEAVDNLIEKCFPRTWRLFVADVSQEAKAA